MAGALNRSMTICGTNLESQEDIGSPAQVPRPQSSLDCARRQEECADGQEAILEFQDVGMREHLKEHLTQASMEQGGR